ncbi:MAG: hypothetical protein GXO15_00875, partial [Crenarchaeota archaeon]|nr:hypothetical protein [Thermoproteota archaeon]
MSSARMFRGKIGYPFTVGELLLAKFLALMHDPPWKPLLIGNGLYSGLLDDFRGCAKDCRPEATCFGAREHELQAAALTTFLLSKVGLPRYCGTGRQEPFCASKSLATRVIRSADRLASSFDRIAAGYADYWFKEYVEGMGLKKWAEKLGACKGEKCWLSSPVIRGLYNVFRPWLRAVPRGVPGRARLAGAVGEFVERVSCRLRVAAESAPLGESGGGYWVGVLRRVYHVFSVLYEPLWHGASGGAAWGPADTRVPTHSVFDHLYASAAAVNLVGAGYKWRRRQHGWRVSVAGLLVYVGWRGLGEWLRGSRKLSDVWVASWLATAMVWYAVKRLVWCLGPDVLLVPGFRWNQFYLSLLREKLGRELFEKTVGDVARDFYFWEGFPYYGYEPAGAVLLLPLLGRLDGDCDGYSEVEALLAEGDDPEEALKNVAGRLEGALRERLVEAWNRVLGALEEAARRELSGEAARLVEKTLELLRDRPPLEPLVVVVPILYAEQDCGNGSDRSQVLAKCRCRLLVVGGIRVEVGDGCLAGALLDWLERGCKGRELLCEVLRAAEKPSDKMLDAIPKLVYALGSYELLRRVEEERLRPPVPGWARLAPVMDEVLDAARMWRCFAEVEEPPGGWENCSVCRRGVAVLRVPGRDTPGGGVSDDYKRFAMRLCREGERDVEQCWRMWRPVLRPGERLCPYCLAKRLAGLPGFFEVVAGRLVGYEPSRRVSFPSTGDVAGLATKLALLASLGAALEAGDEKLLEGLLEAYAGPLAEAVEGLPSRSPLHGVLALRLKGGGAPSLEELEAFIRGRWWTPRLLWWHVARLWERLERRVRGEGDEARRRLLRAAAAVLLAVDLELESLLDDERARAALGSAARVLRGAAGRLKDWRRRLLDMAEALGRPRMYYGLLRFDVDRVGMLLSGLVRRVERPQGEDGGLLEPRGYLGELVEAHWRSLEDMRCSVSGDYGRRCLRHRLSIGYMEEYFETLGRAVEKLDPLLGLAEAMGVTVLVSPSYHWAVANSVAYTLLRTRIVVERLGGVPVYLAGDEGMAALPPWLPRSLLPEGTWEGYMGELGRALREVGAEAGEPLESPALAAAALLPRLMWGSGGRWPGFHPVKPRGRGRSLYRIPALAGSTVSLGLRLAHRRDHLYAEIEAAGVLVEQAKQRGGGLAVSMGRVSAAEAARGAAAASAVLPLTAPD